MVSSYALMALPLGYFIQQWYARFGSRKGLLRLLPAMAAVFFIALNLFQTWQSRHGIIDNERMTRTYYFKVFGKTYVNAADRNLLLPAREYGAVDSLSNTEGMRKSIIGWYDFEEKGMGPDDHYTDTPVHAGRYAIRMDSANSFSVTLEKRYYQLTEKDLAWIRASVWCFVPAGHTEEPPLLVATFDHQNQPYKFRTTEYKNGSVQKGKWVKLTLDYQTPEVHSERDKLNVFVWYRGKKPVFIDDLKAEMYEPQ
jgi:hypothetical protein